MISSKTIPKLFIVESLELKDEKRDYFEGKILSRILKLNNIDCHYYYIRTKKEFEEMMKLYNEINYRYLHISCHGNTKGIATTFDEINNEELSRIINPVLNKKRLFFSACSTVTENLAKKIIRNSGCYSVVGPSDDIEISDAAIMWASIYHILFKIDNTKIKHNDLNNSLQNVVNLFGQPINYFKKNNEKIDKIHLVPEPKISPFSFIGLS